MTDRPATSTPGLCRRAKIQKKALSLLKYSFFWALSLKCYNEINISQRYHRGVLYTMIRITLKCFRIIFWSVSTILSNAAILWYTEEWLHEHFFWSCMFYIVTMAWNIKSKNSITDYWLILDSPLIICRHVSLCFKQFNIYVQNYILRLINFKTEHTCFNFQGERKNVASWCLFNTFLRFTRLTSKH